MDKGRVEFDDPNFKPGRGYPAQKMVPGVILEALYDVIAALEDAPEKRRLDFQPYWDWFDGPRAASLNKVRAALGLSEPLKK
jgi:hypothetical protein